MWFDTVNHVMSDIDNNSWQSLEYLAKNSATKYTLKSYKTALAQEYFPATLDELEQEILSDDGKFSATRIHSYISGFLREQGVVSSEENAPEFIIIKN